MLQLLMEVGMDNLIDDLKSHFATKVIPTIASLQATEQPGPPVEPQATKLGWALDVGGEAILNCVKNLSKSRVW